MALEEELVEQEDDGQLTDQEEDQLEVMVMLAENLIDEGGIQALDTAKQSKDPGQVIGQFLMQLGSQLGEQLLKHFKNELLKLGTPCMKE